MTKLTLGSHPHMLGFEQLERLLERTAKTGNEGYPPFNIEQTSDRGYRITLAVAGFAEEDLSITVEACLFASWNCGAAISTFIRFGRGCRCWGCNHGKWPAAYRPNPSDA
jgi:hypothetical protein